VDQGVKYYNVGLEKVEQVKVFKEAKTNQVHEFVDPKVEKIKEFKEARTTQVHEFVDPKVEMIKEFKEARTTQIREFTDPKVEKIKEFKESRVTQIREFAEPKVEKIKGAMEPKVAVITAQKQKMQKLLRVPASVDLAGLNCETLLGKVASGLEKVEDLIDRYVPLTEDQKKDNDSDSDSSASDSSCVRINRSVVHIMTHLLFVFMIKIKMLLSFPAQLKTLYKDGTLKVKLGKFTTDMKCTLISKVEHAKAEGKNLFVTFKDGESRRSAMKRWGLQIKETIVPTKAKIEAKARQLLAQVTKKLAPLVAALTQTFLFKKVVQMAVACSEKTLGKEKTTTIFRKAETCIPAAWKAAHPPSSTSKAGRRMDVKPVDAKKDSQSRTEQAGKGEQRQQPQAEVRQRKGGGKDKGKGNY